MLTQFAYVLNGTLPSQTSVLSKYAPTQLFPSYLQFSDKQIITFLTVSPLYLIIISVLSFILFAIYLTSRLLLLKQQLKTPHVLLSIKPTTRTLQTAHATEQLFTQMHALISQKTFIEQILHKKKTFALELVATRNEGIRFLLHTSLETADTMQKLFLSYLPGVEITVTKDYLPLSFNDCKEVVFTKGLSSLTPFTFLKSFPYPLQHQTLLTQHDPIAYLTGNMTKLYYDELISLQLVLNPVDKHSNKRIVRKAQTILNHHWHGRDISRHLHESGFEKYPLFFLHLTGDVCYYTLRLASFTLDFVLSIVLNTKSAAEYALKQKEKKLFIPTPAQQLLFTQVQEKLSQPLFETSMRLFIMTNDAKDATHRIQGLSASLSTFDNPGYQGIRAKRQLFLSMTPWFIRKYLGVLSLYQFANRVLSFSNTIVLSITELSSIYHLPYTNTTKTEDLVKNKSVALPTPLSRKRQETKLDITIGINTYGGVQTPIGLTKPERSRHLYIIGKTGMGKSTIIQNMAYQDILSGKGVCIIDPHGDMVEHLLGMIPPHRQKDVVYFNPADKTFPIGLNILRPGTNFADIEEEHDRITESVISIFMKITPEKHWGQRMEHILRNAVLTALQIQDNTTDTPYVCLYTIQKLLTNDTYRKNITGELKDPVLKEFWTKQFNQFKKQQQAELISPIANKIGEFITNKMSRFIILQETSTISISDIMNNEKILLVNLSKGKIGEERSNFFGTMITSLIQLAVYERAYIPESERKDFFVYIDEFQNFATTHFTSLFSEARKYHVFFTPTHQNIEQIKDESVSKIVTGNSGTIIALTCGPDDEKFLLPFFEPEVTKGQIVNLPPHHFFMKVITGEGEDAFSGETQLTDVEESGETKDVIISYSQEKYATPRAMVEKQLEKLFNIDNAIIEQKEKPKEKKQNKKQKTDRVIKDKKNQPKNKQIRVQKRTRKKAV